MLLHDTNDAPSPVLGIERGGTLGGTQYRITVRKIGKYRNTVSKMNEISIPHL